MGKSTDSLAADQPDSSIPPLNPQEKESLLMLIVINYAEEHGLLNAEQLEDARASLRSLFLRATGEETMLRKIIGILKINRALNKTFSEMSSILTGIKKSHQSLVSKHDALEKQLASLVVTPEENAHFVRPLLEFSSDFVRAVTDFDRQMTEYKTAKELEARSAHIYRLAQEARVRLKQRFEKGATEESRQEEQVKQRVYQAFNYAEAESEYRYNKRSADKTRDEISNSLKDFHLTCQMAMKPEMRSTQKINSTAGKQPCVDIYTITVKAMNSFPRLRSLVPAVQDQLKLYQRSFGMFMLDFDKFNNALGPMVENTEDYFQAKEQDEDVRTKQKKLADIEALIAFIEDVSQMLHNGHDYTYSKFSIAISSHITRAAAKWSPIAEQLLHMKVAAEAELITRLA
jgi:uncharacterized protein YoxC